VGEKIRRLVLAIEEGREAGPLLSRIAELRATERRQEAELDAARRPRVVLPHWPPERIEAYRGEVRRLLSQEPAGQALAGLLRRLVLSVEVGPREALVSWANEERPRSALDAPGSHAGLRWLPIPPLVRTGQVAARATALVAIQGTVGKSLVRVFVGAAV